MESATATTVQEVVEPRPTMCKHGIDSRCCAICSNPDYFYNKPREKIHSSCISNPRSLYSKIKRLQEKSKIFATRNGEKYSRHEILFLVDNLKQFKRTDLDDLFKIAKKLKRRYNAIDWWWKSINDQKYITRMVSHFGENWHSDIRTSKEELSIIGF